MPFSSLSYKFKILVNTSEKDLKTCMENNDRDVIM